MSQLTHLDDSGAARMVDVGGKAVTARLAVARATVAMQPQTLALLQQGALAKGDALAVARIAGIQGAKQCANLIPLCHPMGLDAVEVNFDFDTAASEVHIEASCRVTARTGVEMEAMTAVSVVALTLYDMIKAVDPAARISDIRVLRKEGGKTGSWTRR